VVLEDFDAGPRRHGVEQGAFDLAPGDVLGVEDAPFGMAAFLAQIQLARAIGARHFTLGKLHAQLDQFGDPGRPLLHDGADDLFLAKPRAGFERVAHVHLEGILLTGHGSDAALGVVGVGLGAVFLGDDGHSAVRRNLQREEQPGDAAA
jgi:hypothetical protein